MPWYNQWSDSIKKRACRYLLQRYLGQFLEEKLTLDQLTVDLYNGTGSVSGLVLDLQALNELGEQENLPIEFVDGYISEMSVSIPLSQLFTESSYVEVNGLLLTVQPKKRAYDGGSMFESMWNSMSNSMQLAAECLQQTADDKETECVKMEGLELFANAIDSVLTRVKIKFVNTILRLEHLPKKGLNGIAVEIRIKNIDYCDEACSDPVYAETSPQPMYQSSTFSIKKFHCESINLYTDEFPAASRTFSRSVIIKQDLDKLNCRIKSGIEPVLFGKLSGRQEIRLKLKQDDKVLAPKVDIELSLGSLTVFLSPRQMHLIVELVHSLGSPHTQDTSNVVPKSCSQKPMNICDYKKVEQELQENISCPPVDNKFKGKNQMNPGWSSASVEENDEEFFPMKDNVGVSDSIISESAMDTSITSTFTSATSNSKCSSLSLENSSWGSRRKESKKGLSSVGDNDFSGEMTGFNIRLASLSVVILHSDVLIFDADSSCLTPMSVLVMKKLSSDFYQSLGIYEVQGYGNKDFKQVKDLLSASCSRCHIRLLATAIKVEGSEEGNECSRSLSIELTVASFQATECIYSEKSDEDHSSPQFIELLNFMRNNEDSIKPHFPLSGLPDIRLHFKQIKKFRNSNPNAFIKMDISFSMTLQQCCTEIDLSIIDRISAILHLQNLCQIGCIAKETMYELSSFSKAVETAALADVKFDFKLSTPFLVIKFRFPIPDLRPVHDMERSPWWKRNVRKDILYFNLIEPSVRSESNNRTYLQSYKMYCSEISALFQEGNVSVPVPFARATHDKNGSKPTKIRQCIGLPCISFRISPKETVAELEEAEDGSALSQSCFIDTTPKQASPFSFKHVVHGNTQSGGSEPSQSSDAFGEELIVPAEKQEMIDFISLATRTGRIQVDVSLPFVAVHFPSKHFYEVLYNRFNSDLSLWQLSTHKSYPYDTGHNSNLEDYSRDPLFPAFSLCKSGLVYDSDSDSDSVGAGISTTNHAKSKHKNAIKLNGQSKYSLNIAVNQGVFNITTTVKDTSGNNTAEQHGELQINVEEGNVFVVNHFKGIPQQNYICLLVNEAALYFKDVQKNGLSHTSPLFSPTINPSHLSATIYYQHTAASNKPALSDNCKNMLRAAIHTEVNENKVKIIRVSCGLQSATLQHKVCLPQHAWLTQLMDFFDVIDYPVRGYDSPQVITELHQHLWDCTIDYRPLYLPVKSVLTIGNLSLSSNIAARTKSSTFRFIAEDANLFLSDNMSNNSNIIDLKKDYVSVIELGLFELSLRLSDSIKCPKVDLKALINIVDIRTCSDSARSLAHLIKYFASDGDLNVVETHETASSIVISNANKDMHGTLSESTVQRVNNMMQDAMLDDHNDATKTQQLNNLSDGGKDVEVFFFPDEGALNDTAVPVDWCSSDLESEHDFCLLEHEAGSGIMPKSGMPEVRILASPVVVVDNYFTLALGKADLLLPPKHYPPPVFKYTLQDMTLIWHMYGGSDFSSKNKTQSHVHIAQLGESPSLSGMKKGYVDAGIDEAYIERRTDLMYDKNKMPNDNIKNKKSTGADLKNNCKSAKWYTKGGADRNTNILMQLQLNKVKFQHDVYPERGAQASRQVLLVHELEVRDRLSSSNINKFLYQYTSEASPRQSHANMVVVKAVHVRPDPRRNVQETCLKLSLLPLRLNIDQDSLIFLINFFSQLSGTGNQNSSETSQHTGTNSHQVPVMAVEKESATYKETKIKQPSLLIMLDDDDLDYSFKPSPPPSSSRESVTPSPLYIRSFLFSPDVPIRMDYEGKRVDMSHGSLPGLLMGLGQLSCLQLNLKKLSYRHGILGLDKLFSYAISEWVQDIKKNQLPNLIGGVGPMHSLVQLFQGIRDLFWLPIEQYQKDGRIVRGLQKGANSFTTSTAVAALEITARIVHAIQSVAETAFDMLSPGPSARRLHGKKGKPQHHYSRPADIREGIANAYSLVKEGIGETAETLVRVASIEAEQKGAVGAVGGVLRQIPPTVVAPIILASAATSNLIGGVKSQLAPDARREESNKWRMDHS